MSCSSFQVITEEKRSNIRKALSKVNYPFFEFLGEHSEHLKTNILHEQNVLPES